MRGGAHGAGNADDDGRVDGVKLGYPAARPAHPLAARGPGTLAARSADCIRTLSLRQAAWAPSRSPSPASATP